jgi:hypothetical protein
MKPNSLSLNFQQFAMSSNDYLISRDNIQFAKWYPHKCIQKPSHHYGWVTTGSTPLPFPTSIANDWLIKVVALTTFKRKKFTWSCQCEYAYDPKGRSTLHLVDPNIFSPSKCCILAERLKLEVYLATKVEILTGSLNWLALRKHNSFLSRPVPYAPPYEKA